MNKLLSFVKKALLIALVLGLCLTISFRVYFGLADKFNQGSIAPPFPFQENIELLSHDRQTEVNAILRQDFHYLARGVQSFVFLSDDGHYVLKVVRRKRYYLPRFQELGLSLPFISKIYEPLQQKKIKRQKTFITSCTLADKRLKEETGLVYIHMNPTKGLHPTINVFDRLGKRYPINLDSTFFLVQKRAEVVSTRIQKQVRDNDREGLEKTLQQVVNLLVEVSSKGIMDRDSNFSNNVGILGDKAVFIDIGEFYRNDKLTSPDYCLDCITLKTFPFKKWIWKNFPDLQLVQ